MSILYATLHFIYLGVKYACLAVGFLDLLACLLDHIFEDVPSTVNNTQPGRTSGAARPTHTVATTNTLLFLPLNPAITIGLPAKDFVEASWVSDPNLEFSYKAPTGYTFLRKSWPLSHDRVLSLASTGIQKPSEVLILKLCSLDQDPTRYIRPKLYIAPHALSCWTPDPNDTIFITFRRADGCASPPSYMETAPLSGWTNSSKQESVAVTAA